MDFVKTLFGKKEDTLGELISFSSSPGYCDMMGAVHVRNLEKTKQGEWIVSLCDSESHEEPVQELRYRITEEEAADFAAFLKEEGIPFFCERKDSGMFVTDYHPRSYSMMYDNSAKGGSIRKSYRFSEDQELSDKDLEVLKELDRRFAALYEGKKAL